MDGGGPTAPADVYGESWSGSAPEEGERGRPHGQRTYPTAQIQTGEAPEGMDAQSHGARPTLIGAGTRYKIMWWTT